MSILLDTCVISELVSRRPEPKVLDWIAEQEEPRLMLSAVTLGEIRMGIELLPAGTRRSHLTRWLEEDLPDRFSGRIIDLGRAILLRWGQLVGERKKIGHNLPVIDSLIAATALDGKLTLATRNESDFAELGLTIINPWNL